MLVMMQDKDEGESGENKNKRGKSAKGFRWP